MKYLLTIHYDPAGEPQDGEMEAYFTYTAKLAEAGKMIAGDALEGPETATSVRVRDGRTITTDGPFAETKEVLGGYYIVDVDDLDEAISWAAEIPTARHGTVEVWPLREVPGM